jgi:hypothetical protein
MVARCLLNQISIHTKTVLDTAVLTGDIPLSPTIKKGSWIYAGAARMDVVANEKELSCGFEISL